MALMLTLTYRALVQTREEALQARLSGILKILVQAAGGSTNARAKLLRQVGSDSVVHRTLLAARTGAPVVADTALKLTLAKLVAPADSGLPVELWTADGRRVAFVGEDVRDSVSTLRPELRSIKGTRVSEVPVDSTGSDSVQFGALYRSGPRVLFWAVVPINHLGQRIGYLAQQRRVSPNANVTQVLRDLSGEEVRLYFRNVTDGFTSSVDGKPVIAPISRDTTPTGFVAVREDGGKQVGMEGRLPGVPYIFSLETPAATLVMAPRATLRRIALLCLLLLAAAIIAAWALSRRIVRPLSDLTTAASAIARGDYDRRVQSRDAPEEVDRLADSFNRMVSEVQASQHELASQVEEAQATAEELEQTNLQLQEASEAAAHARDAALLANQAKSDFLAVMSHELRTPLNAIGGYADILQMGIYGEVNEAQNDALVRIARSQQTLLSLINDVLNFAKLEAGQVRYIITDVPLRAVLDNLEEFIAPQLRDKELGYTVQPCDDSVAVRADAEKLQQILINLLSNAIKYTSAGGRIDVSCEVLNGEVRVNVADTGIGIAADRLDHIFDPFIQVGRALNRPHEGVGLGLSISRDLAAAMGGRLSVTSTLGEGSVFTLTLARST